MFSLTYTLYHCEWRGNATSQGAAATEQRDGYRWTEVPLTGLKAVRQCGGVAVAPRARARRRVRRRHLEDKLRQVATRAPSLNCFHRLRCPQVRFSPAPDFGLGGAERLFWVGCSGEDLT